MWGGWVSHSDNRGWYIVIRNDLERKINERDSEADIESLQTLPIPRDDLLKVMSYLIKNKTDITTPLMYAVNLQAIGRTSEIANVLSQCSYDMDNSCLSI